MATNRSKVPHVCYVVNLDCNHLVGTTNYVVVLGQYGSLFFLFCVESANELHHSELAQPCIHVSHPSSQKIFI